MTAVHPSQLYTSLELEVNKLLINQMGGSILMWSSINEVVMFKIEVPMIAYLTNTKRLSGDFDFPMNFLNIEGEVPDSTDQSGSFLQGEQMSR